MHSTLEQYILYDWDKFKEKLKKIGIEIDFSEGVNNFEILEKMADKIIELNDRVKLLEQKNIPYGLPPERFS